MGWKSEILDGELTPTLVAERLGGTVGDEFTITIVADRIVEKSLAGPLDADAVKAILRTYAAERVANASGWVYNTINEALEAKPAAEPSKVCGRGSCRASWKCRACGRMTCEHLCSLKTKDGAATCSRCKR